MTGLMWMCSRCGCVGFHSEACIAAASAERIAAQQMATLHDCSEAVAQALAALRAEVEGLRGKWIGEGDGIHGIDYVDRSAVLAALQETTQ